jgi:hypothetical protein
MLYLNGKYNNFKLHAVEGKKLHYVCKICGGTSTLAYDKIKDTINDGCKNEEKHDKYVSIDEIKQILKDTSYDYFHHSIYSKDHYNRLKDKIFVKCIRCKAQYYYTKLVSLQALPKNKLGCSACIGKHF